MNIILLEKIKKLGDIGDEVNVKAGYARNYLVPNKKALYSTPENKKYFEEKKSTIEAENDRLIKEAKQIEKSLSGQEVVLIRAASESGQLFGSVSAKDIMKNLQDKNHKIDKNQIDLNKSIKNLTFEKVNVNLHPEVSCEIILNVARSIEEAKKQKEIGKSITSNVEENDQLIDQNTNENKPQVKIEKENDQLISTKTSLEKNSDNQVDYDQLTENKSEKKETKPIKSLDSKSETKNVNQSEKGDNLS